MVDAHKNESTLFLSKNKKEIDRDVIGYITLFFDGGGYVGINKDTLLLEIYITNTNLDVLIRTKGVFKGEIYPDSRESETRKKAWN
jgi:hypothetical protein